MTFFSNPFSSKRRREADEATELATTGDALAPDTPPSSGTHLSSSPDVAGALARASAPAAVPAAGDSTLKVRARAEYFEGLIRARTGSSDSPDAAAAAAAPAPGPLGGLTAAAAADALAALRAELARVEAEKAAALAAARRTAAEVEALRGVVRELSESRAAALAARTALAEQCADLQRAHERTTRVADLSRAVSKENLELTRTARGAAAAAAKEAAEARREAAAAGAAEVRAAAENEALRRRLGHLERLAQGSGAEGHVPSACRREFTAAKVVETY